MECERPRSHTSLLGLNDAIERHTGPIGGYIGDRVLVEFEGDISWRNLTLKNAIMETWISSVKSLLFHLGWNFRENAPRGRI